jgi:RNA polymerase primary sigma factor
MARTSSHRAPPRPERDSLSTYLDEIGRYQLLSREQEAALGARIRRGDHDALEALVCANLRFAVIIARQYQHRGLTLADLIEEGNLGLVRAAERFDESRGVKFISYAVWWIRQSILQSLADGGLAMRVPAAQAGVIRRIGHEANHLSQELGREPTQQELAIALGMPPEDIAAAVPIARAAISLDASVGDGGEGRLIDVLTDEDGAESDSAATAADFTETLHSALAVLRGREGDVLAMYFGLTGDEPRTLEDIGTRFGITRERVRQIKDKALLRIRRSRPGRALEAFR